MTNKYIPGGSGSADRTAIIDSYVVRLEAVTAHTQECAVGGKS